MNFVKNLFVSLFSGFIPALMKGGKKAGIEISYNKNAKIKDTTMQGKVAITNNEGLEINSGDFNG